MTVLESKHENKSATIHQTENFDFLREIRNEYHREILSGFFFLGSKFFPEENFFFYDLALAILSKIKRTDLISTILASALEDEIAFVYNTFTEKESFVMRPCETVAEIIKYCQSKNYIQLVGLEELIDLLIVDFVSN